MDKQAGNKRKKKTEVNFEGSFSVGKSNEISTCKASTFKK